MVEATKECCGNCKFWRYDGKWGQCRRHAPRQDGNLVFWPLTDILQWCGDRESLPACKTEKAEIDRIRIVARSCLFLLENIKRVTDDQLEEVSATLKLATRLS